MLMNTHQNKGSLGEVVKWPTYCRKFEPIVTCLKILYTLQYNTQPRQQTLHQFNIFSHIVYYRRSPHKRSSSCNSPPPHTFSKISISDSVDFLTSCNSPHPYFGVYEGTYMNSCTPKIRVVFECMRVYYISKKHSI